MGITKEQKLQIVALNTQGKSIKEIAKIAKVSEANVITILENYATPKNSTTKTTRSKLTDGEINEMYRLADEGVGVCEIARRLGIAQSTVSRWLIKRTRDEASKPELESEVSEAPEETKVKEPAPEATGTSSIKKDNVYLNDSTVIKLCQDALLKIGDRIVECDGDSYILGYAHSTLDLIKTIMGDDDENV